MRLRYPAFEFGSWSFWLLIACLLSPALVRAADSEDEKKEDFIVSKWSYSRLNEAHELISKKQYAKALEVMNSMKGRRGLNNHEQTLMWQTFGYIYAAQERVDPAIDAFENCVQIGAMPEGSVTDLQYNLGQLYMVAKKYRKAVDIWTVWLGRAKKVTPDAKFMLAMALVQTKEYRRALAFAREINSVARPKEAWLQLELSMHFELKEKEAIVPIVKRLLALYPKKTYWIQLFAAYMELGDEDRALAVAQITYQQGMLTSRGEIMNLVSLLSSKGVPFEAGEVMEKAMKEGVVPKDVQSLRLLADTWLRAGELERAIPHMRAGAALAKNGDLFVRLAQVHMEMEQWAKAGAALRDGLKKGSLTDPGNTYLLLGIAAIREKKTAAAKQAFADAAKHANTRKAAEQWLKILAKKAQESP